MIREKVNLRESLVGTHIRGAESWQFFAFIFAALLTLAYSLIDIFLEGPPPRRWLRAALKIASFVILGYVFVLNEWVRERLVRFMNWIKRESPR
jgi:hypothetical protein